MSQVAQHVSLNRALQHIKANGGFLTLTDLDVIVHHDRLRLILVRCGNGRFMAPAQDVQHFINIIKRDATAHDNRNDPEHLLTDYVRDISLPTSDPIYKGQ